MKSDPIRLLLLLAVNASPLSVSFHRFLRRRDSPEMSQNGHDFMRRFRSIHRRERFSSRRSCRRVRPDLSWSS
ncbi:unnamed protein product [Cochlearia groenlandica]